MLGETVGTVSMSASGYVTSTVITDATNNTVLIPKSTRIFHMHLISDTTASNVLVANGQGGTTQINITGTISKGVDFDFGIWGITFPNGAYVTVDAHTVSVQITCKADQF